MGGDLLERSAMRKEEEEVMISEPAQEFPLTIHGQECRLRVWKSSNHAAVRGCNGGYPIRSWKLCADHIELSATTTGQPPPWYPEADKEAERKLRELGYITGET